METPIAMRMNMALRVQWLAMKTAQQIRLIHNVEIEMIFAFRGIAL